MAANEKKGSESIIELKGIVKKFGAFTALDSIDLEIKKGEIFGYIGPNGAGKTTTIRAILGILKATQGEAKVFGLDAWKDAVEIHKRLSFVPGDVNLWPNLTGGEVIDLFVSLCGKSDKAKREKLLDAFELDPGKKCRAYSKGNRQKVAVVAALAADVELLVLDEPTSGLDPLMEQVFQSFVLEEKALGKTILLSSHIMSEVERLCDRVGIIREGKLVETGTLEELRFLTQSMMTVETKSPIGNLEKVAGISDIKKKDNAVSFQVEPDKVGEVVSYISRYGLTRIDSKPPTLEELFIQHYGDSGKAAG